MSTLSTATGAASTARAGSASAPGAEVRNILRAAQPPARKFVWAVLAGLGTAGSAIALLAASAWLIVRASERPELIYLSVAVVSVRAFAIGRGVFRYLERLSGHDAALGRLATVRADLVRRLVPLAPDGLGRTERGALLSNLVDDVDELQNLPLRVVQPLVVAGLTALGSIVFVAFLSVPAAMALALCLIAGFALAVWLGWASGARAERALAPLRSGLADALLDELTGLEVLTAYDAADAAADRVRQADEALRHATVRRATAQGLTMGAVSLLAGTASLAALTVAVPGLVTGGSGTTGFTAPELAVVVLLPMAVFEVFGPVPLALASWRQVRGAAQRIAETVPTAVPAELPRETASSTGTGPALGSGIVLRGLSARWPARKNAEDGAAGTTAVTAPDSADAPADAATHTAKPDAHTATDPDPTTAPTTDAATHTTANPEAPPDQDAGAGRLIDVDLTIAPGERLLVTGPTGAGKTTLAHALVRFLEHDGDYLIGGVETRSLASDDARRTVGLCEQTPYLFDESIRQNLLFAHDTASDDDLLRTLDRVGLAEWARERGGLDARVGERGRLVSGGQAQRIALARALLAEFPVLVLDEPTAGVDPAASEALLADLLGAVPSDRAIVLISHVDVPSDLVDRQVRIESGRLIG